MPDDQPTPPPLCQVPYAGPATPRLHKRRGWTGLLIGLNVVSLVGSGLLALVIGDRFANMAGGLVGIPLTGVTALCVTLPSVASGVGRRGGAGLVWLGVISVSAAAGVTLTCLCG